MVHLHPIDPWRHVRAADRHQCILLKLQLRPEQRAFQRRQTGRVADQLIGRAQGVLIKRAGRRNAQVVIPFAAQVLYRSGEAGFEDLDHANTSCNDLG
ncbi:hypothetical protein D3C76_670400 [compost metagenome]